MKESVSQTRDSRVLPANPKSSAVISDNRVSFVSMKKQVSLINQGNRFPIQKRDPVGAEYDQAMTHGTDIKEFDTGKKFGGFEATNDKTKPSAPAWMAPGAGGGDEEFSILAALRRGYGKLGIDGTKSLYVHKYEVEAGKKLSLNRWDKWNYVPEYLYRKTPKDKNPDYSGKVTIEDKEKTAMTFARVNKDHRYHCSTREAAKVIKDADNGKDGYRIEEDLVLKKPEIVLFEKGLDKIPKNNPEENLKEYSVKKLGDENFQVAPAAGGGKTYKWNGKFKLTVENQEALDGVH